MKQQTRYRIVMRCITLWIIVMAVAVLAWPSRVEANTPGWCVAPEAVGKCSY
jgi:hypothetical protein